MKKSLLFTILILGTLSANAQFEQGKWFINPAVTGMDFTYSKKTDVEFGLDVRAGAFVVDNFALLVGLGSEFQDEYNRFTAGVGGRYYISKIGLYLGAGFDVTRYTKIKHTDFEIIPEVGYAFFLSRTVTLEPSVYFRWNTKDSDYSTFGVRLGFGIYF